MEEEEYLSPTDPLDRSRGKIAPGNVLYFSSDQWSNDMLYMVLYRKGQPKDKHGFSRDLNYTGSCRPPFTDYLSELGKEGFSFGDVELPEGAELGVGIQDDDVDGPQAVVAETDNYLIDQSEATCQQVNHQ